jgi:hypothetical protein
VDPKSTPVVDPRAAASRPADPKSAPVVDPRAGASRPADPKSAAAGDPRAPAAPGADLRAGAPRPVEPRAAPTMEARAAAPRAAEQKPTVPAPRSGDTRSAAEARAPETRPEPTLQQLGGVVSPCRLVARTLESTWLRVRTDDGRATEETIPAGEVREWISNRPFVLTIGNAAGVALELNGHKLPPLGGRGVVINRLTLPPAEP